jgi:hypothetical protein
MHLLSLEDNWTLVDVHSRTIALTPQFGTNVPLVMSAFEEMVVQFRAGREYAQTRRVLAQRVVNTSSSAAGSILAPDLL